MSKKQWTNHAMKSWGSANDEMPKDRIQRLLHTLGIGVVFDETIFINKLDFTYTNIQPKAKSKAEIWSKYEIQVPDIISLEDKVIVELDGDVHTDTAKGVKRTKFRNGLYRNMDVRFIQFNTKEMMSQDDETVLQQLL